MNLNRKFFILPLTLLALLLAGCKIWKSQGFKSPTGLIYHNTTARYNAYYYSRMVLKETEKKLTEANTDDYTQLLPLFPYKIKAGGAGSVDMDSVIRRLTIVTKLHPKSKWVDDCYYYIGMAYYFKGDFESSLLTFQYIAANFKDKFHKKKVKKLHYHKPKNNADKKPNPALSVTNTFKETDADKTMAFFKHQPIRNKALLWLVRSYIDQKKFTDADLILDGIRNNVNFPYKLRAEEEVIEANLYIQQKKYAQAIEPLKLAILLTKNEKKKVRYVYILAQVYALAGKNDLAVKAFDAVLTFHPDIDMEFYTNISLAKASLNSLNPDYAAIIKRLEEISKDDKFADYRDQIFYTIAEINLKQKDETSAIANLKRSVRASTTNTNQKGLSFLKLGQLSYEKEFYKTSKFNYDSTVAFISKDFVDGKEVMQRKRTLDKWYEQIKIIEGEDSVQNLAAMSEKERTKFLNDYIAKIHKQQLLDSLNKQITNGNNGPVDITNGGDNTPQNTNSSSVFFAYNPALKASGFSDFQKKWGTRKNEDDWRRSSKKSDNFNMDNPDDSGKIVSTNNDLKGDLTVANLLKGIPLTPEAMKVSNDKIINAYIALGIIYKDDMDKRQHAIETFEKLLERFPQNDYLAMVYYELYLLYLDANQTDKANNYKNLILSKFPDSDFAHIILDPDFLNKKTIVDHSIANYYEATYKIYKREKYDSTKMRLVAADSLFKVNPLKPKFDLLKTLCIGQTKTKEEFKAALEIFVKQYPTGDENKHAKEFLALLGDYNSGLKTVNGNDTLNIDKSALPIASVYNYNPKMPQNLVVAFTSIGATSKAVTDSIVIFNQKYFSLNKFKTSNMLLDTKRQMTIVKQMNDAIGGMNYYNQLMEATFWSKFNPAEYSVFLISDTNFSLFYKDKDVQKYLDFFDDYFQE